MSATPIDVFRAEVAQVGLDNYLLAQAKGGRFVEYGPFFSRLRLRGFADPTGFLQPGLDMTFFAQGIGSQTGLGFNRLLTNADTSLQGSGGEMPAATSVIAEGIGLFVSPEAPDHIKTILEHYAVIKQPRGVATYRFGRLMHWPAAEFGVQSAAASTTVANNVINQSTNGRGSLKMLPPDAWIFLPAKQLISFTLKIETQSMFITADNQPENANNTLDEWESFVELVLWGHTISLPA